MSDRPYFKQKNQNSISRIAIYCLVLPNKTTFSVLTHKIKTLFILFIVLFLFRKDYVDI